MSEITIRLRHSNLNMSSIIFIEDLLDYVFQKLTVYRLPLLPRERRREMRFVPTYTFSSEIGDAIVHILQSFNNIAESLIAVSNVVRPEVEGMDSTRVINLLKFHNVSSLTDSDLDRDQRVWSSQLLDYLVIVTSLSLYFEKDMDPFLSFDVMVEAIIVLSRLMTQRTSEKIDSLKQYGSSTLNEPPLTSTTIYELY